MYAFHPFIFHIIERVNSYFLIDVSAKEKAASTLDDYKDKTLTDTIRPPKLVMHTSMPALFFKV